MQCFRCLQNGHLESHCKKTVTNIKSEKQSDEKKYKSSKSSKFTKTSKAASITKLQNPHIKMKKEFITVNPIIEDMDNEDSDLTNSDDNDIEKSHFQFEETDWFQGVHEIT